MYARVCTWICHILDKSGEPTWVLQKPLNSHFLMIRANWFLVNADLVVSVERCIINVFEVENEFLTHNLKKSSSNHQNITHYQKYITIT